MHGTMVAKLVRINVDVPEGKIKKECNVERRSKAHTPLVCNVLVVSVTANR